VGIRAGAGSEDGREARLSSGAVTAMRMAAKRLSKIDDVALDQFPLATLKPSESFNQNRPAPGGKRAVRTF
jgi:hypothetical protein